MFAKRLRDLTRADLDRLIKEGEPESSELEFKETLPAKGNGEPDGWVSGLAIGPRARDALIAEVIAFANSYGGTVLIGIRETDEKPARAAAITPVPRCAELAESFRMQCRDCIEPQIPLLETIGIETESDGSGVVVVHVPKSMMAPHRSTQDLQCYARRTDRKESMTMREIRDLTLLVERGIYSLEERFKQRERLSADTLRARPAGLAIVAATAIPTIPLSVRRVHKNPLLAIHPIGMIGMRSAVPFSLTLPGMLTEVRPIVRGTRRSGMAQGNSRIALEIHDDGFIEYRFTVEPQRNGVIEIYAGWFMGLIANMLCVIERFRRAADAFDVEFALQVEMSTSTGLHMVEYGGAENGRSRPTGGKPAFPRYSVGPREEFSALARDIERDMWDAVGDDRVDLMDIDFEGAIRALDNMVAT